MPQIILDNTQRVELVLGDNVQGNEFKYSVLYHDSDKPDQVDTTDTGFTTGTTPKIIVPSPSAGVTRHVKEIAFVNNNSAPHTAQVNHVIDDVVQPTPLYNNTLFPSQIGFFQDNGGSAAWITLNTVSARVTLILAPNTQLYTPVF